MQGKWKKEACPYAGLTLYISSMTGSHPPSKRLSSRKILRNVRIAPNNKHNRHKESIYRCEAPSLGHVISIVSIVVLCWQHAEIH